MLVGRRELIDDITYAHRATVEVRAARNPVQGTANTRGFGL